MDASGGYSRHRKGKATMTMQLAKGEASNANNKTI